MGLLLKNASIIENGVLVKKDILVEENLIKAIEDGIKEDSHTIKDLNGMVLTPGLIDLHVHLREPGGEHKETIETGTKAAARGGFTTIAPMPNTRPVPDSKEQMEWLQNRIKETAKVRVLPYAAITKRQIGSELNDFAALKEASAFAFTDDGVGVQSAQMMLGAMKEAAAIDMAIVAHCEEDTLINKGCVHEGEFSKREGLNGIPSVCEAVHIARDVLLAEAANVHYHVCHISTKESVRVVRDAKKAGIRVTAEVTPHHLLLCDEDIPGKDANYKMNPPLRGKEDRDALIEGLMDGTIDFIATDHAPHSEDEKAMGIERAPFGIVGLETAFPLLYTHLVEKEICSLEFLIDRLTKAPAAVFNLPYGELKVGVAADLAAFDLQTVAPIEKEKFESRGKNTPFEGWNCKGWTVLTMVDGKIVYEKETARV